MTSRTLPHSLEAERSVLGAILIDNDTFNLVAAIIDARAFFRDAHRRIYERMVDLSERSQPIDLVTLKEELERSGELEEVGGPAYVASLVDGVPRSTNVEYYAQIVKEKATLRNLIFSVNRILGSAYEADHEADQILDEAESAILSVTKDRVKARALPQFKSLRAMLAEPVEPTRFRIDQWQPSGTRVLVAAQFKAGKTTLVNNVIRSLVDGDPFLGRFAVEPIAGTLACFDLEMSETMLRAWLGAQQIRNDDRVYPVPLRGRLAEFPLLDGNRRRELAEHLRANQVEYVVWDCVRPLIDFCGLDEHKDAGRLLTAFDALLGEAGVEDALVVQHMGHAAERARGDSRFRDWPDVEWRLVRRDENPNSPRFISAYGRDVDQAEAQLDYDHEGRRLTIVGGSRKDARSTDALDVISAVLRAAGTPMSGRAIKKAMRESEIGRNAIDAALAFGARTDRLYVTPGPRSSKLYSLSAVSQRPEVSRECPGDAETSVPVSPDLYRSGTLGQSDMGQERVFYRKGAFDPAGPSPHLNQENARS